MLAMTGTISSQHLVSSWLEHFFGKHVGFPTLLLLLTRSFEHNVQYVRDYDRMTDFTVRASVFPIRGSTSAMRKF